MTNVDQHFDAPGTAEVVRDLAIEAAAVKTIDVPEMQLRGFVVNGQIVWKDLSRYSATPRRASGEVEVHDAESFVKVVGERSGEAVTPTLFANRDDRSLVAILNDDSGTAPGWRDHRVRLSLRDTPEWARWRDNEGPKPQAKFAELIDLGVPDMVRPDAATMLEIAQTFQGHKSAKFKQEGLLQNGNRQFVWEEETSGTAGKNGSIELPDTFEFAVKPWIGSEKRYPFEAHLRWDVSRTDGALTIGYVLIRPDDILDAAFEDFVAKVAEGTGLAAISGVAPAPVRGTAE